MQTCLLVCVQSPAVNLFQNLVVGSALEDVFDTNLTEVYSILCGRFSVVFTGLGSGVQGRIKVHAVIWYLVEHWQHVLK